MAWNSKHTSSATFCVQPSCQNLNALLEGWVSQSMWWWILKWYCTTLVPCLPDDVCWEFEHHSVRGYTWTK
jgi:hypothetical protein